MKYVIMNLGGDEVPILFPESHALSHAQVVEGIRAVKVPEGPGWCRAYQRAEVVSAGFYRDGVCSGKSISLGDLESRPTEDARIIEREGCGAYYAAGLLKEGDSFSFSCKCMVTINPQPTGE